MRSLLSLGLVAALLATACGDDDDGDAGADAAVDAGVDAGGDGGVDAGPMCTDECGVGERCCLGEDGAPACFHLPSDVRHCGLCGNDCIETRRGTECVDGLCACGASVLGCPGSTVCCPPRPEGSVPYCAHFSTDSRDCGGCGMECEEGRADRCDGGECLCGEGSRRQCDGTPEDMCCADLTGMFECVDTTTNRRHCGACDNSCGPGTDCVAGECVAS